MQEKMIVLFDSLCPLCTDTVAFIKKQNDKKKRNGKDPLIFISMHSQEGRTNMEKHGITLEMETFVFIKKSICLIRSDAALAIAKQLGGGWSFLCFFSVIPRPLRDWAYTFVARNRYRWFGKHKTCVLPP